MVLKDPSGCYREKWLYLAKMKARRPGGGTVVVWTRAVAMEVLRLVQRSC